MKNLAMGFQIGSFEYVRDETQSYHRVLSNEEKQNILFFYKNHVYIDGHFEDKPFFDRINKEDLSAKLQRDIQKVQKLFTIFENWGLIPTHNSNVFDIGCGCGIFINQWMRKGYGKGYGIELSTLAKQISPVQENIEIMDANSIMDLAFFQDVYLIVALDIIEHLFDVHQVLSVIASKIQIGDRMVIEIPVIPSEIDAEQLMKYDYLYPTRHLHFYTKQGIETEVIKSGFVMVKSILLKDNKKYLFLIEKKK